MDELEKVFIINKPIRCTCGGKIFHLGGGKYKCEKCDEIIYDDFGKVKQFLEENGPMSILGISVATGVSTEVIEYLLKDGRVEIVEGSKYYLQCAKCGCSIRSGRFCADCAMALSKGIQKVFYNEIGEKPKSDDKMNGKMHFLNKK